MSDTYSDLTDLDLGSEEVESSDFVEGDPNLITPMTYMNYSRNILARKKENGSISFQFEFDSITDGNGHTYRYAPRAWASTTKFTPKGSKGATSGIALYLSAVGIDPKGLTGDALKQAVMASSTTPVGVKIGLEDDPRDRPDTIPGGKYGKRRAYTRDFNKGDKTTPVWVGVVEKAGETLRARARVEGFVRPPNA